MFTHSYVVSNPNNFLKVTFFHRRKAGTCICSDIMIRTKMFVKGIVHPKNTILCNCSHTLVLLKTHLPFYPLKIHKYFSFCVPQKKENHTDLEQHNDYNKISLRDS